MSFDSKQFMETFIAEANERLQEMEKILLSLENGHHDANTIDALFRTAHTVKGSAGMLSLDPIVNFTHIVEDVLDRMRDDKVEIDADLIAVLLDSCDHMQRLVDVVAEQGKQLDDAALARDGELRKRLQAYRAETDTEDEDTQKTRVTLAAEKDIPLTASGGGEVDSDNWHISLRFAPSVLKEGLDPLYLIRYLSNIGTVISMTTLADALPEAAEMDAEVLYLGFEIDLKSEASKKTIADVFEFAHADSLIHILPPHSKTSELVALIRSLPESEARIGDILVATGALTQHELDDSLNAQKNSVRPDGSTARLGDILIDQGSVIPEVVQAALDKQKQVRSNEIKESRYLRVQADKLDELIDLVGELVIAGAGANMLAHRSNNAPLQEATSVISRLVEEIRDSSLKLRMVQIAKGLSSFRA
jgi:two-component system chemotaxis sensor kinase CheA